MIDLPVDHIARPPQIGIGSIQLAHDLNRIPDRRQRIPEFVPEYGDEFVLLPVGIAKRFLRLFTVGNVRNTPIMRTGVPWAS